MIGRKGLRQQSFFLGSFVVLFLLWVVLILSAFAVIYVAYDTRVKFNLLETLRREQNQLQVVWGQYLLEESTWAAYGRVETLAREKLSMQVPSSEEIIVVTP
ncbi:MAG: cell division protein FtsL [Cellvibrionaceae bacterium]